MPAIALNPDYVIRDEATLRALFPPTHDLAARKCLTHLEQHAKAFIARAPFLCIGTQNLDGFGDVSPRGDPNGFVRVMDDKTLLIPDRPGNNRLDTQSNIVSNPAVGLIFMIPGYDDTLRINGKAYITHDPALLDLLKVQDRRPRTAIAVRVEEVYMHCAKAFRRAQLWNPEHHQDRNKMPSLMKIMLDQTDNAPENDSDMAALDATLEEAYKSSMY